MIPLNNRRRLLVAATGSPAAQQKFPLICAGLSRFAEIKIICTRDSLQFLDRPALARDYPLYIDEDQRLLQAQNQTLHAQLADWAEAIVVAPLSSNTLAKIARGINDNLLTRVAHIWNYPSVGANGQPVGGKDMFLFPDMELMMWHNARAGREHLAMMHRGARLVLGGPFVDDSRMGEADDIVLYVQNNLR